MLLAALDAQDLFQKAMRDLGIDELKIRDEDGKIVTGVNLQAMALPDMWLPRLMMRADDIANLLLGERVFNVGYKYDNMTLTGVAVTEITPKDVELYGYNKNTLADEKLKALIVKHSLSTSVREKGGFAYLNDFETYHLAQENDSLIRPMSGDILVAAMLRNFTARAIPALEKTLSYRSDMEPSR